MSALPGPDATRAEVEAFKASLPKKPAPRGVRCAACDAPAWRGVTLKVASRLAGSRKHKGRVFEAGTRLCLAHSVEAT